MSSRSDQLFALYCTPANNSYHRKHVLFDLNNLDLGVTAFGRGPCASLRLLNSLDAVLEVLVPVVHNGLGLALFGQDLCHVVHSLRGLFDAVDANIADEWDTSPRGSGSTRLAVFDSEALLRLDAKLLACMKVDFGIGLAGGRVERGGSTVDLLVWEVLVEADLVERGKDARFCRSADDGHWVALLLEPCQLVTCTWALLALLGELGSDATKFLVDVLLDLVIWHLEVVLLLEIGDHASEVLAYELLEELVDSVAFFLVVLLEKLVGEVCTSFEGETLGEAESVVTVEEDILDLLIGLETK